ncbi:MAG: 50S ribosomal protein L25/general stress protein Ctc [Micrococcaceae bacterium]
MAIKVSLKGAPRTRFGKGAARQLRRDKQIPAVIYGKREEPIHVSIPARELEKTVRHYNALIKLDVDGESYQVLARDVQRDVVTRELEHVDLLEVVKGDKVLVNVEVIVEGEAAPGVNVSLEHPTVALIADVTNIPDSVSIDIEGREVGDHALASDIEFPEGSEFYGEESQLVVNISAKRAVEDEDEDAEEATEGEEATGEEASDE